MKIQMYEDTQDEGDSTLIAENGKVTFILGQPTGEDLVKMVLEAPWSDAPVHTALADRLKGKLLAEIYVETLGPDVSDSLKRTSSLLTDIGHALNNAHKQVETIVSIPHPYRKAIAKGLMCVDKWDEIKRNIQLAKRYLDASPPIVNLLVNTMHADRLMVTDAAVSMLDAQRVVVERLQAVVNGAPSAAHAAVVDLLQCMGIGPDKCPCCGEDHDAATDKDAHASMHAPGTSSIN